VVASLVGGVLLLPAFVAWELRAREPMLPMRFFRSRAFSAGNAAIFFTLASLFAAVFFYAQLLQTGLGYGPLGTGLRLLPWTATFITVAPIAGALADRIGERPLMVGGLTLQAAGMAWLALIVEPGISYSQMVAPFIVAGVGVSMAIPYDIDRSRARRPSAEEWTRDPDRDPGTDQRARQARRGWGVEGLMWVQRPRWTTDSRGTQPSCGFRFAPK
jgi:predicted MFS family arabinose efflux permease